MDGIFSNDVSNTLQYFTFPLEAIGLTLATIEVRFPGTARWITNFVGDWRGLLNHRLERPVRFFFNWMIVGIICLTIGFASKLLFFIIVVPITVLFAAFMLLAPLLIIAHTFVEGRAVGTLGIIIAGFGVLGEAYQFAALMLV
jgi:hypothetical protein